LTCITNEIAHKSM